MDVEMFAMYNTEIYNTHKYLYNDSNKTAK